MLMKRSFYEEVSRVPLIVHVPWMSKDEQRVNGSIGHADLVPTLLDLMGQDVPEHLQGESRKAVLQGDAELVDDVFMQWHGGAATISLGDVVFDHLSELPWRSMVSGDRWKLNLSPTDTCELYDLNSDPLELTNLYDQPEFADRVAEMTDRMREWQARTGDELEL